MNINQEKPKITDSQEAEFQIKIENTNECRIKYIELLKQKIEFGEYPEDRLNDDIADGIFILMVSPHALKALSAGIDKHGHITVDGIKTHLIKEKKSAVEFLMNPKNSEHFQRVEKEFYMVRDMLILFMIYYDLLHNKHAAANLQEFNAMRFCYERIKILDTSGSITSRNESIKSNLENLNKFNLISSMQLRTAKIILKELLTNI